MDTALNRVCCSEGTTVAHDSVELRPKLTVQEQIVHMKGKGILFAIVSEEEAAKYLEENTYYFKLKCYAKLYEKYKDAARSDQYSGLEFAYLQDLATIDSLLRKYIIQMSLDLEHYLRVSLIRDFSKTEENGYDIISKLLSMNPDHYDSEFNSKRLGKACSNLVQKYDGKFAIWNIVEVLGFSDFQELYNLFYNLYGEQLYGKSKGPYAYFINPVRLLRNGAAHNNCLLSCLKLPYVTEDKFNNNPKIAAFIGEYGWIYDIGNKTINTNMGKPLVHDFCAMLYLFHLVAPNAAQIHVYQDLLDFFTVRCKRHSDYYVDKNMTLVSAYRFVTNVTNLFLDYAKSV